MTLIDKNEAIAKQVSKVFTKINNTAVNGYKKTEETALYLWGKTENFFVKNLFKKEGESLEDTKNACKIKPTKRQENTH